MNRYDALLIVSFGGPEKHEDVIPFLENVLRGRNVPRERMLEVAEHYYHFDGRSPINDQNRALIAALREYFERERIALPIYWGNRNWHPLLAETVRQMRDDGVRRALAFVTSAFGSYSGCRQYIENIEQARAEVEGAPRIDKIPSVFGASQISGSHDRSASGRPWRSCRRDAWSSRRTPCRWRWRSRARMCGNWSRHARRSRARSAAAEWKLVYQSRSGPPTQPWLEPDICDELRESRSDTVIVPIGFLSDHMEVIYDLDVEARELADELGIRIARARTVETHPAMIEMIAEFVNQEHMPCAAGCCAAARRPTPDKATK